MLLEESILNNKIKISEKEQNRVNEYKVINIKHIYNAFFKNLTASELYPFLTITFAVSMYAFTILFCIDSRINLSFLDNVFKTFPTLSLY